ncbi:unnamed protein product [Pipistrellus nathusii]|uniref:Uncharacterized protein n=1 Tax=Pipistrellus nathusii TaxID=59473 RepID=A0ABP0A5Z7_PIPNA
MRFTAQHPLPSPSLQVAGGPPPDTVRRPRSLGLGRESGLGASPPPHSNVSPDFFSREDSQLLLAQSENEQSINTQSSGKKTRKKKKHVGLESGLRRVSHSAWPAKAGDKSVLHPFSARRGYCPQA